MILRALDSNGDWTFGAGKNNYLRANAAVAQAISSRLLMILGDCFWATNAGIDWFNLMQANQQLALNLAISATILNTENVTGIIQLSFSFVSSTRALAISYNVSTLYGPVQAIVTQNLGVGPVTLYINNPLLPQFNQTLNNNASATAITNAVFNSTAWWEVDLPYFIERRTSTQSFVQRGVLFVTFNVFTGFWSLIDDAWSGSSGPTTGVVFSVNASMGQVSYASDNVTGSGYVGNLIIGSGNTFVAGA